MRNIQQNRADIALFITRVIIGGVFIYSGWAKLAAMEMTVGFFGQMGIPAFLAYVVSYGELIAGVLLVLGLWTLIASTFLTIVMIVAVLLSLKLGFQMYSMPLVTLAGVVAVLGGGSGKYRVGKGKYN